MYATIEDVKARCGYTLTADQERACAVMLEDCRIMIDSINPMADFEAKRLVSCNMVIRALKQNDSDTPIGATQGSMSALGYSQSWTFGKNGSYGELYLSRSDKRLLGYGNKIGASNPLGLGGGKSERDCDYLI